jgi:hypothetical protein
MRGDQVAPSCLSISCVDANHDRTSEATSEVPVSTAQTFVDY